MAYKTGKNGGVKIGAAVVAAVQSWSLDVQTETAKGWGMGDEWTDSETTVKSWSGNVEAYLDPASTGQTALVLGTAVALELYPHDAAATTHYYSGTAIITGKPISASKGDFVSVTFNFEGKGALVEH